MSYLKLPPHHLQAALLQHAIGMQGFDRLVHLCHFVLEAATIPGDVVEFGCYEGRTAVLLGSLTQKTIWVYDSFQGLPKPSAQEESANPDCRAGALRASSGWIDVQFRQMGRPLRVKPGFFADLSPQDLPHEIAFAHIDADLASSTVQALSLVYEHLSPGAICVIDDYGDPKWPGAEIGVTQFMADKPELLRVPKGLDGAHPHHCYFVKG